MLCVSTVVNPQVTVIQAKACPKVVEVVSFWAAMASLLHSGTVDIVPANRTDRPKCAD